jgi:RNA polymerase sigma factor (sigma-70 family)
MTGQLEESGKPQPIALFTTTHWTVVLEAGDSESPEAQRAISQLCRIYWYPLYAYVRRQGYEVHQAQDLTQEFFAHLLSHRSFRGLDRQKGRFRSWLLASLENFLAKEWRDAHRLKRGGNATILSLDAMDPEDRYQLEPSDNSSADRVYERRWALTVVEQALTRLRAEFESAGRLPMFQQLQPLLTDPGAKEIYAQVAAALNMTPGAVKVAVCRMRQRYGEILRQEVAQTVARPEDVEAELHHLANVLAQ